MRFFAYVIAVLAAAGIIYFVGQSSDQLAATGGGGDAAAVQTTAGSAAQPGDAASDPQHLVTLSVPDMHCPFACYPAVKEDLEAQPGVLSVDLAEQQVEGVIDNPQVLVQFDDRFDRQGAIDSLAKVGFGNATVVE